MKNKRGLSTIVGTMLTVLLTIVAVGVLWYFTNFSFSKGERQLGGDCLNLQLEPLSCMKRPFCEYFFGGIIYEADVTVKRHPGEGDLREVRLVFEDVGQKAFVIDEDASNFIELQSKNFLNILVKNNVNPFTVKASALVGNAKGACQVVASPVECEAENDPPAFGYNPSPAGSYKDECCQYPWNLTSCIPQGSNPSATPKKFCCSQVPGTSFPPSPSDLCNYADGTCSLSGALCSPTSPCDQTQYPQQYCNYPPTNNCCVNQVSPLNYNVCI